MDTIRRQRQTNSLCFFTCQAVCGSPKSDLLLKFPVRDEAHVALQKLDLVCDNVDACFVNADGELFAYSAGHCVELHKEWRFVLLCKLKLKSAEAESGSTTRQYCSMKLKKLWCRSTPC